MKANTKKWFIIGGSLLVIGGVAYYFFAKPKSTDLGIENDNVGESGDAASSGSTPPTSSGPTLTQPSLPNELKSPDSIKKFQDFMDSVGAWVKGLDGRYKKLNKGTGYGIAGPSTQSAFKVYGDLYRVFVRSGSKGRIIPIGASSIPSVDVDLSNGHIARYQLDKKFVDFSKNYGSAENTGSWSNEGRKIVLTYGSKKGKTLNYSSIWDTLKALIS